MNEDMKKDLKPASFNYLTTLLKIVNRNDENDINCVLARYFLEHFNDLDDMSINAVADECYVSRSSVQRFIKYLGADSFTVFKDKIPELKNHEKAFLIYTNHEDFQQYLSQSINDMMQDINHQAETDGLDKMADLIGKSRNVVLMIAETSNTAGRNFQQAMMSVGKLVRLISDATTEYSILESMDEDDLLITASTTGNYAYRLKDQIRHLKPAKALITLNHYEELEQVYKHIFYLSGRLKLNNPGTTRMRNVYTTYGMVYFFDLLFHAYAVKYQQEPIENAS
ncbi:MAG: hypothetical protein PUA69_02865 [Erysipelotrichaceae bacterium]|nr:hypothetical protein [Erysipelotrichaceae bacterium]